MNRGIDLEELHRAEEAARQNFERDFEDLDPRPEKPARFSARDLGIEFPLTVLTGIAAIVQAAMRTGYKFFELASKQGMGIGSWLDGASAMIGVEGFIAVIAFTQARARGKTKVAAGNTRLSLWRELAGAGVALTISIAAGFAQSITGSTYIPVGFQKFVDWMVVLALGLGASVLAYFAGEIAGSMVVRAEALYVSEIGNYDAKLAEWKSRFRKAWEASDQYQLLHVDIHGAVQLARAGYRLPRGVRSFGASERTNEKALKVLAYLDEHSTPEFVPGATQVAAACGVSKSYASEMTKEWRVINQRADTPVGGENYNGHHPAVVIPDSGETSHS